MEKLEELTLGGIAEGVSLVQINDLKSLKSLYLRGTRNVAVDLSRLKDLVDLELHAASVTLLETLSKGNGLASLMVSDPLERLDLGLLNGFKLRDLQLFNCDIKNFESVQRYEDLRVISVVSCTGISDFTILNELSDLSLLDIRGMDAEFDVETVAAGRYQIVTDNVRLAEKLASLPDMGDRLVLVNEPRDSRGRVMRRRFYRAATTSVRLRQGYLW
jgi:hypothetical protein